MVVLTSFSPPTEGIKHQQPSTKLLVNGRDFGAGTLFIAESALSWRNIQTGEGFSLDYPNIAVHAITREIGNECLYLVVDNCIDFLTDDVTNKDEEDEDDDNVKDDEDGESVSELRFMPEDKGVLDAMYHAMTHCQALHPDPQQAEHSLDEEDEEYLDADEDVNEIIGDNEGGGDSGFIEEHANMDHTNGYRHSDEEMDTDGQFEDAEAED